MKTNLDGGIAILEAWLESFVYEMESVQEFGDLELEPEEWTRKFCEFMGFGKNSS